MSWERIRGHAEVIETFRQSYTSGRLGHAYLFVGPEGIGKRLVARELAKAVLCERPPRPLAACDSCPSCVQVGADTHPDLLTLRTPPGKHELPVEAMREFCRLLARRPLRGTRRVGVVEDADDLNSESANSFLKTLEEPPPGTLLVLIATSTDRQLPTILSRCQVVRFSPLSIADVIAVLAAAGIDDETHRARLGRLSAGSVARALALDDPAVWKLREELVTGITDPRPNFSRLAETWEQFILDAGKDTSAQRSRASVVIAFLLDALRVALRLASGAAVFGLDPDEEHRLRAFADRVGIERLLELIECCVEADHRVERRVQLVLVIESVLGQLTRVGQG